MRKIAKKSNKPKNEQNEFDPGIKLDCLISNSLMGDTRPINGEMCFERPMKWVMQHGNLSSLGYYINWCPSTNITDAFDIIDRLKTNKKFKNLVFKITEMKDYHFAEVVGFRPGFGKTAAHAICLAALHAIGVHEDM